MTIEQDIINRLSIFKNFYDEIRITGPYECEANIDNEISQNDNKSIKSSGKSASFTSCASSEAYYSDDTIIKYDFKNGEPVNVIASPINIDGKNYIVEMIKKIPKNEFLFTGLKEDNIFEKISELNYKALHDDLTNVYNRRYIDEKLQQAISSSCESRKNLSIIMCDIDYFKCVNDTYGHQCGDEMLKCFASIINHKASEFSGWTGRYGGEEFICLIPGKNSEEAYAIAESMRDEFEKSFITFEDKKIKSTASFGIASVSPYVEMTSKNLIKIADTRLYAAKEHGRNLVVK